MNRLVEAWNVLKGKQVALEDVGVKVLENIPQMYDMWWSMSDISVGGWSGLTIYGWYDAYERISEVQQSINATAHFSTRKGFQTQVTVSNKNGKQGETEVIKDRIDNVNRAVNMDQVLYLSILKREIYGRAAWEYVRDGSGNFNMLKELSSQAIRPHVDTKTNTIDYFQYYGTGPDDATTLDVEDVLYFPRNPVDPFKLGVSAIASVQEAIKLKLNLRRDLLESSKRLWAPLAVFIIDTTDQPTEALKSAKIQEFRKRLKPGQAIIHNTGIDSKIINMKPDLQGLIKSLETADQEIFGNWQMPKALFSREKTVSRATLEYSLKALYQGPIEGVQRFFKRGIESQFYDRLLKEWGYEEGRYHVKHNWTPSAIYDSELINALNNSVKVGAISVKEFHDRLGWEMPDEPIPPPPGTDKPEEPKEPEPPESPQEKLQRLGKELKDHMDSEIKDIREEIEKVKMMGSVPLSA